eukprot:s858_g32.t1
MIKDIINLEQPARRTLCRLRLFAERNGPRGRGKSQRRRRMGFFDDPSYDIDLEKHPEMPAELLVSEIGHSLRFKGHCVLKLGMDEDALDQATDEAVDLKRAGKLQTSRDPAPLRPPPQLIDALLGPEALFSWGGK